MSDSEAISYYSERGLSFELNLMQSGWRLPRRSFLAMTNN